MNKQSIPMLAAIAIAAVVLTSLAILSENNILPFQNNAKEFDWQCSGPICIQPSEVKLGANLFIVAGDIPEDLTLRLAIIKPDGEVWDYIWADGSHKTDWNMYIKPDLSQSMGICTVDELVGLWTIELQGTMEMPLQFQHGPAILEGSEEHYKKDKNICP